jgi:hypothetical protein
LVVPEAGFLDRSSEPIISESDRPSVVARNNKPARSMCELGDFLLPMPDPSFSVSHASAAEEKTRPISESDW